MQRLPESVWRERITRHVERLRPFVDDRLMRMSRREKHPVRDFLFQYYSYRPAQLLRWSPGPDVLLNSALPSDIEWNDFTSADGGIVLDSSSFPEHRRSFAMWALNYLQRIAGRPPMFGCFGLHEWAMVYRAAEVRHSQIPLRLSANEIARVIESEELCCTHFDAYRFFTPAATPRNRYALDREITDQFDQPGCIHVTMDLYRYAYKLSPWVTGELIADAFELAWKAREIDMRASPYDLAVFALEPIRIETRSGKEEYVERQRELVRHAQPIRVRLLGEYQKLVNSFTSTTPDTPTSQPLVPR
jgi:hypothetical protein